MSSLVCQLRVAPDLESAVTSVGQRQGSAIPVMVSECSMFRPTKAHTKVTIFMHIFAQCSKIPGMSLQGRSFCLGLGTLQVPRSLGDAATADAGS